MKTEYNILKDENKFFLCECKHCGILINNFQSNLEKEIYLSIFAAGQYIPKPSFWQRIKYAIMHIKTGKIYDDQIILSHEKANEIADYIKEIVDEENK